MFVLALLMITAAPVDPADAVSTEENPAVEARVSVARVNGVALGADARPVLKLWPLDDVILTGAESGTPHDPIKSFHWELIERPATSRATLSNSDGPEVGFAFLDGDRRIAGVDAPGRYAVRLWATTEKGERESRTFAFTVAWPGRVPRNSNVAPVPDAVPKSLAPEMGLAAGIGCCAGAAAAGLCVVVPYGAGLGLVLAAPCATTGAAVGTIVAATDNGVGITDLSPWLLVGPGMEVGGIALLVGAGAFYGLTITGGGPRVDPNLLVLVGGAGGLLVLAAPPITVVTAYVTAPDARPAPVAHGR